MVAVFTPVPTIPIVLNFDDEQLVIGDTIAFVEKMNSWMAEQEVMLAAINTSAAGMTVFGDELNAVGLGTAYEVAVNEGFVGTVTQWLASLVGPQGIQGIQGVPGTGAGYVAPPYAGLDQTGIDALVAGDYVITDDGRIVQLVNDAIRIFIGDYTTTTALDAFPNPQYGDYATVGGGNYYYYDSTGNWLDTGSTSVPVVPANANISPTSPSSSWVEVQSLPSVSTESDLDGVNWGNYPDGVLVESTGQTAYRIGSTDRRYQHVCGVSATAWTSIAWVNDAAASGQAARMQCEVTADTYCRMGFQIGTNVADSLLVEVQPTQIQAYDSDVAEGSSIAVNIGDIIGIFRLENGTTIINVNKVDVFTFTATDTSAVNLYAYLFGVDDCIKFAMNGVDGAFLYPSQWDGLQNATMTEEVRTDDNVWSYDDPSVTTATSSSRFRVVYRSTNQTPELGGWPNIYPDGATVNVTSLADQDLFTLLIAPGQTALVDGVTISADAGYTNLEPVHFAKLSGAITRLGGN